MYTGSVPRGVTGVPSVSSVAAAVRADGGSVLFVRPSRRSPSGFSLVCSFASLSYALPLAWFFCAAVRRCPGGWSVSFAVSGVRSVPPVAVARLAGCPVWFPQLGVSGWGLALPPVGGGHAA